MSGDAQGESTAVPSRFGELAVELLGAKMAADLVREVWQAAPPEVKQELAGAVLRAQNREPGDGY